MDEAERTLAALTAEPDALEVLQEMNKKNELRAVDQKPIDDLPVRKKFVQCFTIVGAANTGGSDGTTSQVGSESAREGFAGSGVEIQRGGLVGADHILVV